MSRKLIFFVGRSVARNLGTFFGAATLLVLICAAIPGNSRAAVIAPPEYRPDQILVQPKKTVTQKAFAKFHTSLQSEVVTAFPGLNNIQVVRVPAGETVTSLIAKYQQSGLVEYAEPDYAVHACGIVEPNDPFYQDGTDWWLNNTGQSGGTPGADISAPKAWGLENSASNIIVAVLDSGIRYTHEDLAPNMWTNPVDGTLGFNGFTGKDDIDDDNEHGTLVAGILGAAGNNGVGTVGVCWKVQMMACKCLDHAGNGNDSVVVACLDYARTNGARVINCSFSSGIRQFSQSVSNAIVACQDAGIIVVASAGNGFPGLPIDLVPVFPACYTMDNILTVAYTTRTDTLSAQSNFGATSVDLAAPGDQISSTYTNADNGYFLSTPSAGISGTSFAAPMVAGACALVMAKYPSYNYHQIIARVLNSVDPLPSLAGKCATGGRLNLYRALFPSINLTAVSGTNGLPFQLRLDSGTGFTCVIQSSPDLMNWSPVFTNTTDTNGVFYFTDPASTNGAQRFYRAFVNP